MEGYGLKGFTRRGSVVRIHWRPPLKFAVGRSLCDEEAPLEVPLVILGVH